MTGPVTRNWDVLCLGLPVMEFVETTPGFYRRMPGGDAARVAVTVARSGGVAAVAGRLGPDGFGVAFREMCRAEGVDETAVLVDQAAPTAHGFRHLSEQGGVIWPAESGAAAALMRPGDITPEIIGASRLLHISATGCAISPGFAALAREASFEAGDRGTRVSIDLRLPAAAREAGSGRVLAHLAEADVVTTDLPTARALLGATGPEDLVQMLAACGPRVVVLWMGAEGVWLAGPDGRKFIAPFRPGLAGDADVFIGYFLSGLTAGDDLAEAAIRASAAAAHADTHEAARSA
ncbi:hypothetical protein JQU17_10480 [Ponticoccus sp. SC2-23]|uniref:carbohydrate kinase family protein n=1 Tax=Alexandriicola marinus TaxID=2081710 RepID=UPI000FD78AD8|nr:PfkB family carbohydrate kinase [Alexandriicola marinus]MBM1219882.1 hypothetical protein [Ponticoccus sp. SC6-9]MBM1224568.1 hypothetical protein [Ponticoccus sp. SC6-15]MBM1228081.1 hypothetical protein [Ponticoccus sp. SC6-38]MBM1234281.1 hypothetical protein [Ponticoccus sp. SC6-45]MBM1238583.1 hypothetical protein [Ponticoccus sp. SC6-49]MBM1242364.1 hypothetical protein [Ponticoccus sp. SC2-64]MBM1247805.1 hypothetical protein [Ponticoccus sp. SC6-42]MBM1251536.1 hypothetical prote